jgi:hypothetical protein
MGLGVSESVECDDVLVLLDIDLDLMLTWKKQHTFVVGLWGCKK